MFMSMKNSAVGRPCPIAARSTLAKVGTCGLTQETTNFDSLSRFVHTCVARSRMISHLEDLRGQTRAGGTAGSRSGN